VSPPLFAPRHSSSSICSASASIFRSRSGSDVFAAIRRRSTGRTFQPLGSDVASWRPSRDRHDSKGCTALTGGQRQRHTFFAAPEPRQPILYSTRCHRRLHARLARSIRATSLSLSQTSALQYWRASAIASAIWLASSSSPQSRVSRGQYARQHPPNSTDIQMQDLTAAARRVGRRLGGGSQVTGYPVPQLSTEQTSRDPVPATARGVTS
jgi:hypothetical protein